MTNLWKQSGNDVNVDDSAYFLATILKTKVINVVEDFVPVDPEILPYNT